MRADFTTRLHVGKDIRAAKGVNCLFRIANQQQRGVRLMLPDTAENTVLLRVGILELINHRDRKTGTNRRRQRIAAFTAQRCIQTAEHIVKTQLAAAAFLLGNRRADLRQCPGDHQIADCQRLAKQLINSDEKRVLRRYAARFGSLF